MLTSLFIFTAYLLLFIFILYRLSLKPSFGLSFSEAALAFIIKAAAGCFYGYFFLHYYGGDDTWLYHNQSLQEYALLKNDPIHFFINDIFTNGYKENQFLTIFNSSDSFAKNLEITLLIKLLAVFDFLSGGRYYVNVIFYNVLVFWGCYYVFVMLKRKFPEKRMLWLLFIFYFPPLLFWTSGIRKDGVCFALICGVLYQLYYCIEIKANRKHVLYFFCLFIILFLIRNYIALSFIPVAIAYKFSKQKPNKSIAIFITVLVLCAAAFFSTSFLPDSFNFPLKMAERQQAFLQLKGDSYLPLDSLIGNLHSYLHVLPQALNHVFIRPYFFEAKGMLYLFSSIEISFFFLLLFWAIIKPSPQWKKTIKDPLILSFIVFALINYIIIGYTVPFMGAFVRYKASFEIFFILVFLQVQKFDFDSIKLLSKKHLNHNENSITTEQTLL